MEKAHRYTVSYRSISVRSSLVRHLSLILFAYNYTAYRVDCQEERNPQPIRCNFEGRLALRVFSVDSFSLRVSRPLGADQRRSRKKSAVPGSCAISDVVPVFHGWRPFLRRISSMSPGLLQVISVAPFSMARSTPCSSRTAAPAHGCTPMAAIFANSSLPAISGV